MSRKANLQQDKRDLDGKSTSSSDSQDSRQPSLLSHVPPGELSQRWTSHRFDLKLVNPANRRRYSIIVVGSGLAGSSAAASLAEMGYQVTCICLQDSPRRAHSIAAQGGINAAKNYPNDGDSIFRLFYDTIKGGDYRARESNVYRLAEISNLIIDQCVAQGVPFAREYGGLLSNRSFGGAQVSRTFYARGQTGQQLLLGAYGALSRQIEAGHVRMLTRREMLDVVVVEGTARGIVARNLLDGSIETHAAHAVLLATGGYGNAYYLSTNAKSSNVTATYRAHKRGAMFANPCFVQIHPTCIPVSGDHQSKLTLMSESLRNDGRVWVPRSNNDARTPAEIPEKDRLYFLEDRYPAFGNLVPRDVASRAAKEVCDAGQGVGTTGQAVYLDLRDAIDRLGMDTIRERYGNLFQMYQMITGEDAYTGPMRIYPAVHYTMGGLWVDYNLMTTIPGLFALGEANFSDHGANRLGASALMQGLADGYFIVPHTLGGYLAATALPDLDTDHSAFTSAKRQATEQVARLASLDGGTPVEDFHRLLGRILWDKAGMARSANGLREAQTEIAELRDRFWVEASVPGRTEDLNTVIERAGRIADFLDFGQLIVQDALHREESCGSHFRVEHQTIDNEALRDDEHFSYVAAWEHQSASTEAKLYREELTFDVASPTSRSYK